MTWLTPQGVCLFIVAMGAATDLTSRRIPNGITLPAIAGAFFYHGTLLGWVQGGTYAVSGLAMGGVLLLVPFLMGGMGGGDVKLLGALGAWLGARTVLNVFIYAAWLGAIWAVVIMVRNRTLASVLKTLYSRMVSFHFPGGLENPRSTRATMPYAVAIAAGYVAYLACGRLV